MIRREVFPSHPSQVRALVVVAAAFLLVDCFPPLRTAIQLGGDEGMELGKATLCLHGHHLYTEIWNDQPPPHTFIITEVLKHFSPSVFGPRLVTVGFSLLLLVSFYTLVRRISGAMVAALATALLIASPGLIAGALFGAAVLMKLVPIILLPVAALLVWMRRRADEAQPSFLPRYGEGRARLSQRAAETDMKHLGGALGQARPTFRVPRPTWRCRP